MVGVWQAVSMTEMLAPRGRRSPATGDWLSTFTHEIVVAAVAELAGEARPAQLEAGAVDDAGARRPDGARRGAGPRPSACLAATTSLAGPAGEGWEAPPPQPASKTTAAPRRRQDGARKQYACVMHRVCALPHSVGGSALARSPDAPSPPPPAARRRPPVPHRRRPRDHADLPPRARPALLRGLRPARGRRRPRRAARATSRPTSRSRASAASASSSTPRRGARTPTGRAQLGYSLDDLDAANRSAVALAEEIRAAGEAEGTPIVINGVIGPRGDGYDPGRADVRRRGARRYHAPAGRDVRRQRRRHGHRGDDDLRRGGDRHRARRARRTTSRR